MAAPKGNKYWQLIDPKNIGRKRSFETPEDLMQKFIDYCEWVDNNPWQVKSASSTRSDNESVRQQVHVKTLPYTLYGFTAFAVLATKWVDFASEYRSRSKEFSAVIDAIESICTAQQIDGAIVNEFNGNLVARLNNITETSKVELTGKDGEDFRWPKLSTDDFEELRKINEQIK